MGGGAPVLNFELFWFGDDDGTDETDNTFLGAKNSNQTLLTDTNYRFRVSVSNTGTKAVNGLMLQLEYNHEGGGWNAVDDVSSVVIMSASTKLVEGNDCTERLAGAQAFDGTNAGQEDVDGLTGGNNLAANNEQEADYCFQIVSGDVANAETIVLRVTDAGTPLDNDNQTPTLTVSEPIPPTTINLGAASLTIAGQQLDVQPGAVTKNLAVASLTLAGQQLDVSIVTTINLNAATLTLAGQQLDIQPGAVTVPLNANALTLAGQQLDVQPGVVTISLGLTALTLSGQQLTVVPGAVTIPLNANALTLAGQQLDVQPGTVTISLNASTLTINGQQLTVTSGDTTILLDVATLTLAGQQLSVIPGAVTIPLNANALTLAGQQLTVSIAGVITINLDVLTMVLAGLQGTVFPGIPPAPPPAGQQGPGGVRRGKGRPMGIRDQRNIMRALMPELQEEEEEQLMEIIEILNVLDKME
jgi:hypothetical protein